MAESKMVLELTGPEQESVLEQTSELLARRLHDRGERIHEEEMRKAVQAAVDRCIDDVVRPEVARLLATGWQATDSYGNKTGQPVTLQDRITKYLQQTDSYHRGSNVETACKAAIDEALRGVLGKEIEAARVAFNAQVKAVIDGKLAEAIRDSVLRAVPK